MPNIKVPAPFEGIGPPEPVFEYLLTGGYSEPNARKMSDTISRAQQATGANVFIGGLGQVRSPDQALGNYFAGTGIPASKHLSGMALDVYADGPQSPNNMKFHRQLAGSARESGLITGADFTKTDPAHIEIPGSKREARRVIQDYYDLHGITREDVQGIKDAVNAEFPGKANRETRRSEGVQRLRALIQERQQPQASPHPAAQQPTALRVLEEATGQQKQQAMAMQAAQPAINVLHEEAISMGARHAAEERHPAHPSASAGPEDYDPKAGTAYAVLQALSRKGTIV